MHTSCHYSSRSSTKKCPGQATTRAFSCIMDERQAPATYEYASNDDAATSRSTALRLFSARHRIDLPRCLFHRSSLFFGILIHLLSLSLSQFLLGIDWKSRKIVGISSFLAWNRDWNKWRFDEDSFSSLRRDEICSNGRKINVDWPMI